MATPREWSGLEIAIVGMAGRFPGAADLAAYWANLAAGVETIRRLEPDALIAHGRDPAEVRAPEFVPAHGVLDGFDQFDAEFFGYRLREAEAIDPQQRIFLEVAWEALEHAGCDPARYAGAIGVFAGSSTDHYLHEQLHRNPAAMARIGAFQANYSNQPDHLAARVAYKLNLSGVAVAVQSACSTSLVAVHLACQHLLTGACDMALAGGVSLTLPRFWGYRHEEGMILSPDGHCRAFDAQAQGTLKGDGAGAVVLKRLADALADGDTVHAVILGSAANNDGSAKVGYTAPGLDGQRRLIAAAHAVAGVDADSIGYVEAHGTGTPLGDPIEVAALTQAFRRSTERRGFCGLGSVKTSIGHLDAAAGVAALIKTVLALRHATLPASLNFNSPNPALQLATSPFRVVDRTEPWPRGALPRRAAVSSFGIGGTNAHAILEEAPEPEVSPGEMVSLGGPQLLLLSARTPEALDAARQRLADHLDAHPELRLADIAHTLAVGRHAFAQRVALVAGDAVAAGAECRGPRSGGVAGRAADAPAVVFLFPGQGAQYFGMGRGLYEGKGLAAQVFREQVDHCCEKLRPRLGFDLRSVLFADEADIDAAARLQQTEVTQPALFVIEYSLAQALLALGIVPAAMAGHSLGEIVAACVAGVFTLDDALALVVERARLMQAQPPGAMLSVPMDAEALQPLLGDGLSLAAENAPGLCVAAGPADAIDALAARLASEHGLQTTRLQTSHAFHSSMMEPAVAPFLRALVGVAQQSPTRRFASSVTGTWFDAANAGPSHWAANLRGCVRFGAAVQTLLALGDVVMLEVGPGTTLTTLARRHPDAPSGLPTAAVLRHPRDSADDATLLLRALGRLWCAGADIGTAWLGAAPRRRVPLPTYPFERQRCWVDPAPDLAPAAPAAPASPWAEPVLYRPAWVRSARPRAAVRAGPWFVVGAGPAVAAVRARFEALGVAVRHRTVDDAAGWRDAWPQAVAGGVPDHLLILAPGAEATAPLGIPALLRSLAASNPDASMRITLAVSRSCAVLGDEEVSPDQVLPIGWLQVLPSELPGVRARVVDLDDLGPASIDLLLQDAAAGGAPWVAYRRGQRWERSVSRLEPASAAGPSRLRPGGVYAISGGLGNMGLALAEHLARSVRARLLLFGRSPFPPREAWASWLAQHSADQPVCASIRRLLAIEALGSEVLVATADAADPASLAALRDLALARWGVVHGLIHAAGTPGGGLVALQDEAQAAAILAPKVAGTRALLAAFGDALDFVVLCSSLASFLPLPGRSDYTAANLWLDAWAHSRAGRRPFTVALNWDNWREGGMARAAGTAAIGMSNAQGVAAFARALEMDEPQLLVAMRDLQARPTAVEAMPRAVATPPMEPASAAGRNDEAGGTPVERQLLQIAGDLLGVPAIGLHDDFFDLGGDSVVSIQLVARARRAGLPLTAKQVFELRTVAAMAAAAGLAPSAMAPTPGPVAEAGTVALSPIQHWFFGLPLQQPGHWNLGLVVATPVDADPQTLRACLQAVVARHEVLGLRFVRVDGVWQAQHAGTPALDFEALDLSSAADAAALERALEGAAARAQRPFELAQGPLLRAVHAHCGARAGRLFIGVHHLVADLIAARLLLDELEDAWQQRHAATSSAVSTAVAALAGTPWSVWTERLGAHAQTPACTAGAAYWSRQSNAPFAPLPRDHLDAANTHESSARVALQLDARRTAALLAQAGAGAGLAGALLAALAQVLCAWSGQSHAWIDVEGHGRVAVSDDVDVSRSVGWFTAPYPLAIAAGGDPHAVVQALREVPLGGMSFGLLRHLHADLAVRAEMAALPVPEVVFLFQGVLQAEDGAAKRALPLLDIQVAPGRAGSDPRSHLFEVNAWIEAGCLRIDWGFSRAVHEPGTVEALVAALQRALPTGGAVADAGSAAVDALRTPPVPVAEAERTAPLSFAQERIWFLQQLDLDATVFNKQCVVELDGELDTLALQSALGDLLRRHETLRTRFVVQAGTPQQRIGMPAHEVLEVIEAGGDDPGAAQRLARERANRPFDLSHAAPFDAALLRLAPQRHWLLLTLHHIVTDAWSLQVLVGELAALYSARRQGHVAALPPLALRFADFAQAQRQALSGSHLEHLLRHWTRRLAGLTPIDLPTDRPRPAVQRFDGARVHWRWPAGLTAALRGVGRSVGASPFMVLLALYTLLLHRYSGQTDIVVGSPAADRPNVDTEALLGPLVNNLVLRTDLQGEPDFRALLTRVRDTVLDANEHRDLPFEKLVEALKPTRDRSRSPLFQVMFAYMNVPAASAEWAQLDARTRELEAGGAEFDLSLYAYAPAQGEAAELTGWFEYSTALFDPATVERLAGHLQQLAEAACREPDTAITRLPLLTPVEHRQIVTDWNRTARDHEPVAALHTLFERQAARRPGAIAAVFDDVTLTYAELDRRANRLARHLRSLGVAPDDRVAICVERVSSMLVGLLAILKAGAAYVPVDPGYPADRIAHMVGDSGARVVLTQARWRDRLASATATATVVCLDRDAAVFQRLDDTPLMPVTQPHHLAYVIYTSGSTGTPKGTQLEHGAVVNFVQAMVREPGLRQDDALLAVTTISFDIHVLELFVPLACGARVVVASREMAADGQRLRRRLEAGDITAMQATPATWRMLLDAGWSGAPTLKLLCGGEALAPDLAAALLGRCGELWNMYGPTEATVWATCERIVAAEPPISIGRPFDNMRAYVLDRYDQPLPVGVPGELCLGGRGVARGYLNRPELTAERFRADPFVDGERIYRTGDLARWRADGRIDVLGRLDNQVKLRGHRVELGEIETVLSRHTAVAQCVCIVREDRPGDQRLVAYAIADATATPAPPDLAALRQFGASTLPDYMLPSAVVWLDAYPLTPNGKIDRRALPAPSSHSSPPAARAATPLTPAEAFFAEIFAAVLGPVEVGAYDNFFDLGGHSLLVMKVVDLAQQRGGLRLHPGELFQQTVGQLAALHGPKLPGSAPAAVLEIERLQPMFFAGSAGTLYGCLHAPMAPPNGHAVLICPPIGPEYPRSHRALRQLAALLARRGAHALRFDYHGMGDSEGDAEDLRLATCRRDVACAIDELRRQTGARTVSVVGLRLGATLALQAVSTRTDVTQLLLWHPVWDGSAMLADWRAEQREFITALGYRIDASVEQALGVPLPAGLIDELGRVAGELAPPGGPCPPSLRCLVAPGTDEPGAQGDVLAASPGLPSGAEVRRFASPPVWRGDPMEIPVPADTLRALADWLTETL